jgi:hypothetical protein
MLKLHVDTLVSFGGKWRGDIGQYFTRTQWDAWFANYIPYAVHYARLAEASGVDQLAIGTELIASDLHADHWRRVVSHVRSEYAGTVTYACNFWGDNLYGSAYTCQNVTWWDALDLIGVDAYFPIAKEFERPSYAEMARSWAPIVAAMRNLSQRYQKPLIFTEIGYTSQVRVI